MSRRVVFVREGDEKVFEVVFSGHWTAIEAHDGESYSVKWFGPDKFGYVGVNGPKFDKRVIDEPDEF